MPKAPTPPTPAAPVATDPKAAATPPVEPPKPEPKSLLPRKTATPKVETPAPAGDDPFEKFALPDTAPEEQKGQFTELKRIAREQKQRLKELEGKVNAPVVPTAELEKLRAEHKAAMDRIAVLDLQSHPDFKRQFQEPKTKALAEVNEILTYSGKEGVDLAGLLGKDRKAFSAAVTEMTKDLNPMDATTVQTALRDAYRLTGEEKAALANSGELRTKMQQQAESQTRQVFDEVSANLGPIGEFLVTLDVPDGATAEEKQEIADYNQSVTGIKSHVEKTVFGPTNEKSMAVLGWKAGTLDFLLNKGIPRMEKTYASVLSENEALRRELAAVKGVKGGGPISGDPGKGGGAKKTNDQLVAEAFRGQGA